MPGYAYLKDYVVVADTQTQIAVTDIVYRHRVLWFARSDCENGVKLKPGDIQVGVLPFFAEQEGLNWSHYQWT